MHTSSHNAGIKSDLSFYSGVTDESCIGIGVAECVNKLKLKAKYKNTLNFAATVTASESTSTEYLYTINFATTFSTSTDPTIAGHPSDVIVGGGTDLVVVEAIKGIQ